MRHASPARGRQQQRQSPPPAQQQQRQQQRQRRRSASPSPARAHSPLVGPAASPAASPPRRPKQKRPLPAFIANNGASSITRAYAAAGLDPAMVHEFLVDALRAGWSVSAPALLRRLADSAAAAPSAAAETAAMAGESAPSAAESAAEPLQRARAASMSPSLQARRDTRAGDAAGDASAAGADGAAAATTATAAAAPAAPASASDAGDPPMGTAAATLKAARAAAAARKTPAAAVAFQPARASGIERTPHFSFDVSSPKLPRLHLRAPSRGQRDAPPTDGVHHRLYSRPTGSLSASAAARAAATGASPASRLSVVHAARNAPPSADTSDASPPPRTRAGSRNQLGASAKAWVRPPFRTRAYLKSSKQLYEVVRCYTSDGRDGKDASENSAQETVSETTFVYELQSKNSDTTVTALEHEVVVILWTGVFDSHKGYIYQNDIVREKDRTYRVRWNEHSGTWSKVFPNGMEEDFSITRGVRNARVIGNIYEQPHLMDNRSDMLEQALQSSAMLASKKNAGVKNTTELTSDQAREARHNATMVTLELLRNSTAFDIDDDPDDDFVA